jgi:N-acetylneuraminic acid mutarotase
MRFYLLTLGGLLCGTLALDACDNENMTAPSLPEGPGRVAAPGPAVNSNTWLMRRNFPSYWADLSTATVSNAAGESIVYAIGGSTATGACLGRVRAYNVTTDTWRSRADLPVALCGLNGAGVINGKIHVSGGVRSSGQKERVASLFVFDPATNVWTQKRDMPEAGSSGITGVMQGKLYVVTVNKSGVANLFRYSPTTDRWSRLPSTDYWWLGGGGGVINGKLYLIAQAVKVYDPSINRWTTKGPLPGDLHGSSVVLGGQLYIFGADTRSGSEQPGIFVYDPVSNAWTRKSLLATLKDSYNIHAGTRVFLNGQPRVEVIGGGPSGNNLQYIP